MIFGREMRLALAAVITVFAIMVAGAFAAEHHYYVATTGTDDNATGRGESSADPWETITYALAQVSGSSGDPAIIHIAAGTYKDTAANNETFPLNMESYVSIVGENRETTILDAESAAYHVIVCDNVNDFTIENLTITGGVADGSHWPDIDAYGAGIWCYQSSPTISKCEIRRNRAEGGGGAIACHTGSSAIISNNILSANSAIQGGAIWCWSSSPSIKNNIIGRNSAMHHAGGIYADRGSHPTIEGNVISHNSSHWQGGGIDCYAGSSPTISENVISFNSAYEGGGISCKSSCSPHVFNNLVLGNTKGGGIYCTSSCSPNIDSCTIAGNVEFGIKATSSSPVLCDCIVWDNDDDLVGISSGASYCDIEDGDFNGSDGNISEDPLFVSGCYLSQTAAGQSSDSPCVDAGSDTAANLGLDDDTTRTDEVGDAGRVDMGYHYRITGANTDPVLYAGCVDPEFSGDYATFTYVVIYYDADRDAPVTKKVFIDGDSGHEMTLDSGNTANGIYVYQTSLAQGDHSFYFYFEDGNGGVERDPASGAHDGPSVGSGSDYFYVDGQAGNDTTGDGSVEEPWKTITHALANTEGSQRWPVTIHIRAGKYSASTNGETFPLTLRMKNWVSLSGAGADTVIDARNSAYHVVYCWCSAHFAIDSLKITGGLANGTEYLDSRGGGVCLATSWPTIKNCEITGNSATASGGGICCHWTQSWDSPTIVDCVIYGNSASEGGGIWSRGDYHDSSHTSPRIFNNLVVENTGGAIYCETNSSPDIASCTIDGNESYGVKASGGSSPSLINCILWNNGDDLIGITSGASYCNIQDGDFNGSSGNISSDPEFRSIGLDDMPYDGYFLYHETDTTGSPCIDTGDPSDNPFGGASNTEYSTDHRNNYDPLMDTNRVDMGYHYKRWGCTYIELVSFETRPQGSSIVLTWETGTEIDNAGFVIYRAIMGTFDYQQVSDLIAAEGSPASGASYSFTDNAVEAGVTYNYWLIDVETSGKWTAHGPRAARLPLSLKLIELPNLDSLERPSYNANCQLPTASIGGRK